MPRPALDVVQTGQSRGRLVLLVVCTDILVMRTPPGLGFVFLIGILAGATHWVMRGDIGVTPALSACAVLFVSLIPVIDVVQFTSFIIAWLGLTVLQPC